MPQLINMPPRRDVHADGAAGGAADGGAPPGLDNALIAHDRVRRTTDIPLFYGIKEKDTITPQQLIDRLERAARVARWATDELKCDQFFLSLRDEALKWSDTLDNIIGFDKENWQQVKSKFLAAYAARFTAKTLCISFQDLKQKSSEDMQTFYNRVSQTFRNAYMTKPDHVTTYAGERFGLNQANANTVMAEGLKRMELLVMNTVFLGGLKEDIRNKVLEEGPTVIEDSVTLARDQEAIYEKNRVRDRAAFITSVAGEEDEQVLEVEEDEAEHLAAVNAIRKRQGLPGFRYRVKKGQGFRGKGSSNQKTPGNCFFCNKPGHRIANCNLRKAGGKVNEVAESSVASVRSEPLNF